MIKAFIFDLDGVIIDSEPLHYEADKIVFRDLESNWLMGNWMVMLV